MISITTILAIIPLVFSFYMHSLGLFLFSTAFILSGLLNRIYLNYSDKSILIEDQKHTLRFFPDDHGVIKFSLKNIGNKPIVSSPLSLVFDQAIIQANEQDREENKRLVEFTIPVSVNKLEEVEVTLPFRAIKRGVTKVSRTHFSIQHPFGFGSALFDTSGPLLNEILVYPKPLPVTGLEHMVPRYQGEYINQRALFENQLSPLGTRNYTSGDPFNRIHWKATARTTVLQTKVFEKNSLFAWMILVNIKENNGIIINLENVLGYITYICQYAVKMSIDFELFINIRSAGSTSFFQLSRGTGREQLSRVLELLARVNTNTVLVSFENMLLYIEKHHQLSPYIILCGSLSSKDKRVIQLICNKGIDCYRLIDNEGAGYLSRIHKRATVQEGIS